MPESKWRLRADGSIEAHPIVGWEAGSVLTAGLLRITFATVPEEFGASAPAIQFALTADQAKVLAQDLMEMTERIERTATGGTRQ